MQGLTFSVHVRPGLPQMAPNAGQALLNQLRNAQQAPPQQQVRPEQLTGAGAALLAQLQAASRDLQPPHQQQPNMVQQPNAAGANLLAQLQDPSPAAAAGWASGWRPDQSWHEPPGTAAASVCRPAFWR